MAMVSACRGVRWSISGARNRSMRPTRRLTPALLTMPPRLQSRSFPVSFGRRNRGPSASSLCWPGRRSKRREPRLCVACRVSPSRSLHPQRHATRRGSPESQSMEGISQRHPAGEQASPAPPPPRPQQTLVELLSFVPSLPPSETPNPQVAEWAQAPLRPRFLLGAGCIPKSILARGGGAIVLCLPFVGPVCSYDLCRAAV